MYPQILPRDASDTAPTKLKVFFITNAHTKLAQIIQISEWVF